MIVSVFGATGVQGGSVLQALSQDPSFTEVRALTRNSQQADTQLRKTKGINFDRVSVIQIDFNDISSVKNAIKGSNCCFVVTNSDLRDPSTMKNELVQGTLIADACRDTRIEHVVFSTLMPVQRIIGVHARHCDSKAQVEDYMKQIGLPLSCIMLPFYFEDFLDIFKPRKLGTGVYGFDIPMSRVPIGLMSCRDIGECVKEIFMCKNKYLNHTINLCANVLTVREIADIFNKHLVPNSFKDTQLTLDNYRQLGWPGCIDYGNMFDFLIRVDTTHNVPLTEKLHPGLKKFEQWVMDNRTYLLHILE
ncbi:unnamed protein product [Owenia fusiformis]|uniref:NmrA-like family domain-containing protein 1 n=1 Tax=Owenia fusiformis TaxID=6347 RepID=A0A8J1XW07_OWEFU|nr:unnamed protein product [Owenia fusiformis]